MCKASISTFRRHLRKNLNITYKSIAYEHKNKMTLENKISNVLFINQLVTRIKSNNFLIFVEESNFQQNSLRRKLWHYKSENKNLRNNGRIGSITVIGALAKEKLLYLTFNQSTNNADNFCQFLEKLEMILKADKVTNNLLQKKQITIILDNSKLHTAKITLKQMKKTKINFLFHPPYSPYTNAIELLWGVNKKEAV